MRRFFSPCRKYREDLCVLMSGDLSEDDRACLENHLEACADCRRYRDEIGSVTALLSDELFPNVEPRETAQMRWARDFDAALEPAHSFATTAFRGLLDWSRDIVWPCRRIWAGMAAVWVLILGLNASQMAKEEAQISRRHSLELMRALLAQEGWVPAPVRTEPARNTEPPRPPSTEPRT